MRGRVGLVIEMTLSPGDWDPDGIRMARLQDGLDKSDAAHAVFDAGKQIKRGATPARPSLMVTNDGGKIRVELPQRLEKPLGVSRGHPANNRRSGRRPFEDAISFVQTRNLEFVWGRHCPFERTFIAERANATAIGISDGDLADPKSSRGAAFKSQHHMNVVIHSAAGNKG